VLQGIAGKRLLTRKAVQEASLSINIANTKMLIFVMKDIEKQIIMRDDEIENFMNLVYMGSSSFFTLIA
jgi:hypothetical protein